MWQHSFRLQIKKILLHKYVNICYWTRTHFILEHFIQIKVTTKFLITNNKNSMKNDPFVETDLLEL